MTTWTDDELTRIGGAEELRIASFRRDGTMRKPVIVWVVRAGDRLFVRSAYGRSAAWFRGTQVQHQGHIEAGGVGKDVTFAEVGPAMLDPIDDAYRTKYRRHGTQYVDSVTNAEARGTTIELVPR